MSSSDVGDITNQIYKALRDLDAETSSKILRAVTGLLDVSVTTQNDKEKNQNNLAGNKQSFSQMDANLDAKKIFADKNPNTKSIEFAIAARIAGDENPITKEILKTIIKDKAKRSFDEKNFGRDIDVAIRAGFFIKGKVKGEYDLSHYGESYVDLLPDQEAAKLLKRPKKAGNKPKKKKASK